MPKCLLVSGYETYIGKKKPFSQGKLVKSQEKCHKNLRRNLQKKKAALLIFLMLHHWFSVNRIK
jgi:hypothetical protein